MCPGFGEKGARVAHPSSFCVPTSGEGQLLKLQCIYHKDEEPSWAFAEPMKAKAQVLDARHDVNGSRLRCMADAR